MWTTAPPLYFRFIAFCRRREARTEAIKSLQSAVYPAVPLRPLLRTPPSNYLSKLLGAYIATEIVYTVRLAYIYIYKYKCFCVYASDTLSIRTTRWWQARGERRAFNFFSFHSPIPSPHICSPQYPARRVTPPTNAEYKSWPVVLSFNKNQKVRTASIYPEGRLIYYII